MLIVNLIQSMLAPGIMISACGLLLLGMNNKYSLIVSRIRALNEEKRNYFGKAGETGLQYEDEIRINSLAKQLQLLHGRAKLVRNAVFFYSVAVGLFVITSLIIGLALAVKLEYLEPIIMSCFSLGMIQVLGGIGFAAMETVKGYQIISYEIKVDE